jgi:hypothetical protein
MGSGILAETSELRGTDHPANMLRIFLLALGNNPASLEHPSLLLP